MLVCLACYGNRLASVFENAAEYKLYELDAKGNIYPAGHLSLPSKDPTDRTSAILACGVSFLVCGAVCCRTRHSIEASGMSVAPFVKGSVDDVLEALRTDTLDTLAMPGCTVGRRGCRLV